MSLSRCGPYPSGVTVTSTDVARRAGVSQATVSRVLGGSDRVAEPTRSRVLQAMAELGYSPNLVARAMKTKRTSSVGVLVAQLRNPFYPELLLAIGGALDRAGQRMVLFSADSSEDAALDAIGQGLVDGVMFTSGSAESPALRAAIAKGAPVVLLNRSLPGFTGDQVTNDNPAGAAALAEHLVGLGHRRIAFLGGPAEASTTSERADAFRARLAALGAPLDPALVLSGPLTYESGAARIRQLLSTPERPTAVFGVNDITAIGAIDGARGMGVAVPDELSVVGYDDIDQADWAAYRLTTVRQPVEAMARRGVELLIERIADPGIAPRYERLPAELVQRESTAAL